MIVLRSTFEKEREKVELLRWTLDLILTRAYRLQDEMAKITITHLAKQALEKTE